MKRVAILALILAFTGFLFGCGTGEAGDTSVYSDADGDGWVDSIGYEMLSERVYYFEFFEYDETSDKLTPRECADIAFSEVVKPSGLIEGISEETQVFIAFDSVQEIDGIECYLYDVSIGDWENEDVDVLMIVSVNCQSGAAAMHEDRRGPGAGDSFVPERDGDYGRGDIVPDDLPAWTGVFTGGDGFALNITSYDGSSFMFYITMTGTTQLTVVLEGEAVHEYPDYNQYEAAYDGAAPGDSEVAFGMNEDSSIDIRASEGSEWEHLRGSYERIYSSDVSTDG